MSSSHISKAITPTIGTWLCSGSPIIAELLSGSGFDFVCVDAEHSPVNVPEAHRLFQAIRSGNRDCASWVRLPEVDYSEVKRYLDAGADGVIAPLVNTRQQAEILVQAVKYPPVGARGLGFCRANEYGRTVQEVFERANNETMVCVQIEHVEAVKNIDAILSVEGVDAVFVGPFDLSASMGLAGEFEHPKMKGAIADILSACERHSVVAGIHVIDPDPETVKKRIDEGFELIAYSLDITMLNTASTRGLSAIRSLLEP